MTSIRDVSDLAGVSVATVSRTLSRPEKVKQATREKVMAAVKALGYQPNMLARNFRTKRTNVILVIVPNIANLFFSQILRGIEKVAAEKGYAVLIGDTNHNITRENAYAGFAARRQADGVIQLSARVPEPLIDLIRTNSKCEGASSQNPYALPRPKVKHKLAYVNACEFLDGQTYPTVGINNQAAAYDMVRHLINYQHKHIAIITGPKESPLTQARYEGTLQALLEAGLELPDSHIVEGDFTLRSGKTCSEILMERSIKPTALFCFNDEMAIGALQSLSERGLSVPKDISVAGFDNIDFSQYSHPPLTTISQPTEDIGRTAMEVLYNMLSETDKAISNKSVNTTGETVAIRLPTSLIARESTGPVPKD